MSYMPYTKKFGQLSLFDFALFATTKAFIIFGALVHYLTKGLSNVGNIPAKFSKMRFTI